MKRITRALLSVMLITGFLGGVTYVVASTVTSTFTQVINPGTLAVDIVDASYVSVVSPSVVMNAVDFSYNCQTSTGVFGTASQRIYVQNPDAADNGWSVSLAASSTLAVWDSAVPFSFNDPAGSGCTNGQMTIDPSGATLTGGQHTASIVGVSKGSLASFSSGLVDNITILTGAASSDDIGDWLLTGVNVSQKIPAQQPAANDYSIDMILTVVAS